VTGASGGPSYAAVAVPVPVRRLFTYEVDTDSGRTLRAGSRVRVSFGPRKLVGTVVEWPAAPPDPGVTIKPIDGVLSHARPLPPALLELTRFVADYYLCSWGEAIETALPPDPGPGPRRRAVRRLSTARPGELPARALARRRLLEALPADGSPRPLASLTPSERRLVRPLAEMGCVEVVDEIAEAAPLAQPLADEPEAPPHPTPGQAAVLEQIAPALAEGGFNPFLLFGATGSGKTEIYLRASREVLDRGRGVLWLVPEIGLTPLLVSKVSRRFPGAVALLHSGLSKRERYRTWTDVRDGRCRLVVGTRSALFAPVRDLGLIIVDEEQDGSYKQAESPRYNARDLAVVRAQAERAVLVMGSATPSMETFRHAQAGRYGLLRLGGRILSRPLPTVRFVDMRREFGRSGEVRPVSEELAEELRACMARGDQALVMRNRRGWAAAVFCPTCGGRVICANCSVTMTWHRSAARLRCHYCASAEAFPESCPTCGAEELKLLGEGTERIEDILAEAVPEATIVRMDRDTVRGRGAHERLLRRFDRGEIDILVGTQMIAKGHDFPRVTLVGVLSADQSLGLPDFRAGERVFQLLTQVAGRAGRGERPGTVLVQVFEPDHPLLLQAARQDYEAFFEDESRYRRALRYPPYSALVQLIVSDREASQARLWAGRLVRALRREGQERLIVSGPGPAPLERLQGKWRQQILVRTAGRRRLIGAVERSLQAVEGEIPRRALHVDVDPYSLL
jgi:primosomal protein N' (replication factor Y)